MIAVWLITTRTFTTMCDCGVRLAVLKSIPFYRGSEN